jgi:hypothetical protein
MESEGRMVAPALRTVEDSATLRRMVARLTLGRQGGFGNRRQGIGVVLAGSGDDERRHVSRAHATTDSQTAGVSMVECVRAGKLHLTARESATSIRKVAVVSTKWERRP